MVFLLEVAKQWVFLHTFFTYTQSNPYRNLNTFNILARLRMLYWKVLWKTHQSKEFANLQVVSAQFICLNSSLQLSRNF
jgi:hypothetical protein